VKSVSCNVGGKCASGGTDHDIRLFDIGRGVEMGELQEHTDTVVCVECWGLTSLITGGEDGQVCVWRCGDWELLLKFRAHKASMTCLAIHPSGRMMASAAKDNSVRLWDLVRGTSAAIVPVDETVEALLWSPAGDAIAAMSAKDMLVVNMSQGGAVASYRDPSCIGLTRISMTAAIWLSGTCLLVGDGKGDLRLLALRQSAEEGAPPTLTEIARLPTDNNRVRIKALVRANSHTVTAPGQSLRFAVGTSSGRVEVWSVILPEDASEELRPQSFTRLHVVETNVRLTCMAFWQGPKASQVNGGRNLQTESASVRSIKNQADVTPSDSPMKKKRRVRAT